MVIFDHEKCIGCGLCAVDCFPKAIKIEDKKAYFMENHNCMECGHCIAVCPRSAVKIDGLDMDEVLELKDHPYHIDPEVYLNHLKVRRTIRAFTDKAVSAEQINMILDAGRFSPSGGNRQTVAYHIFRDRISEFRSLVMDELKAMGDEAQATGIRDSWYSDLWLDMYNEFKAEGTDALFFNAGTAIVVSSDSPQAALIAAAHMETMVYSLGLGMIYSGFTTRAIGHSAGLQEYLGLKEGYRVWAVLAIGYAKVKYQRTVPRKKADVLWE